MKTIRSALLEPLPAPDAAGKTFELDVAFADLAVARALGEGSWTRNASWVTKFKQYVADNGGADTAPCDVATLLTTDSWATAFLSKVLREDPLAKTKVKSAQRAINLLRAFGNVVPLHTNSVLAKLLSRAASNNRVSTVRKAAALPMCFLQAMIQAWGFSKVWWQRQLVLVTLLAFCAVARGGGICTCVRTGITWVRVDGTMVHDPAFIPTVVSLGGGRFELPGILGFLLLLPFRKNKLSTPSWMPIMELYCMVFLCVQLRWLRRQQIPGDHLFVARRKRIIRGVHVFVPAIAPQGKSKADGSLSVDSFRLLLRKAAVECCGATSAQAMLFGTHSVKNGAIEALRARGADSETRRQLGDWMSPQVALSYLQLSPDAQFALIRSIR